MAIPENRPVTERDVLSASIATIRGYPVSFVHCQLTLRPIADAVEGDSSHLSTVQKTNSYPICLKPFHFVQVYKGQDRIAILTYEVEDKKASCRVRCAPVA
ncbi:hypothetical protein TrVGV298_011105 [Trichoderma virens]|nr:hypothetical protein TrVGV298_011105 [Trichoderma virens]